MIATSLLRKWRLAVDVEYESKLEEIQLKMFLGGEGGTGKSRIIDAVKYFCQRWGMSKCLSVCATTGKSAVNINGRTIHSYLNSLGKNADKRKEVSLIVIDEISMLPYEFLVKLDEILRKDNTTKQIINQNFLKQVADRLPRGQYPIRIVGDFQDSEFNRQKPFIDVFIGMSMTITQNVNVDRGVGNGTTGYIYDNQFPIDTKFDLVEDNETGMYFLLPNKKPEVILGCYDGLVYNDSDNKKPPIGGSNIPDNVFPLFPQKAYKGAEFELSSTTKTTINILQFPLVCSIGNT
eukprot:Awhi_evm1s13130